MSSQAVESDVTAETPGPGSEVFCPSGDGNRILDHEDKWPMRCPQCQQFFVTERPEGLDVPTEPVELPTVGRIVHVLIAPDKIRPAIVMGVGGDETTGKPDGRLFVTVFKDGRDPTPSGLGDGVGVVSYGSHVGGWFWPARQKKADTFDAPIN